MKHDVRVPGLRVVDVRQGVLGMEWIEGWSVRQVLGGGQEGDELPDDDDDGEEQELEESEHVEELLRSKGVESGGSSSQAVPARAIQRSRNTDIPCQCHYRRPTARNRSRNRQNAHR